MSASVKYIRKAMNDYLKELSARTIVPGGGSASAASAALGVSLNLMVINFSLKPSLPRAAKRMLLEAKKDQERRLGSLMELVDEDCAAFSALMKAFSAGRAARKAYMRAAAVPLEVCRECRSSMAVTRMLLGKGNKNLLTDVGASAHMLVAAFHSAKLNVLVNLKYMGGAYAQKAARELSAMERYMESSGALVCGRIDKAMRPGGK